MKILFCDADRVYFCEHTAHFLLSYITSSCSFASTKGLCLPECIIVRVLQRNRTTRVSRESERQKEIVVQGTGSHDYARWKVPSSAISKLENEECRWCTSSSKAAGIESEEDPIFQFKSEGKKRPTSRLMQSGRRGSLLLKGRSAFVFYSGLQGIEYGTPMFERAICFT